MARTVAQLPGVMVAAPLIVPMAAQLLGVMVPVLPKVRVVVQRVGDHGSGTATSAGGQSRSWSR